MENGYTIVTNIPNEGERARDTISGKQRNESY